MKIGHFANGLSLPGGIRSYVNRVTRAQSQRGDEIFLFGGSTTAADGILQVRDDEELLEKAAELSLDVLHTHDHIRRGHSRLAIVRTLHSHQAYCPTGGRFLHASQSPCPRTFSWQGCLYGHFFDRCGSIRLANLTSHFSLTLQEMKELPKQISIAISPFVQAEMVRAGYDEKKIKLVYHPNPAPVCEDFSLANNSGVPRFVYVGRITPEKGLRWVIQAVARMKTKVDFEIIGEGNDVSPLKRLAAELGIADRFQWSGWIPDEAEVQARMKKARAVVFPSLWPEPAGLITLEAAAAGRALIGSKVGGIPDYAARLNHSILVEPGDLDGMVNALSELAESSERAEQLGRTGWQSLRDGEFSTETHLKELDAVYEQAMLVAG